MQFINNFRGIAILLVVLVHAISAVKLGDSTALFLLSSLLKNCTILFVVVAGYLFSYQLNSFNYKRFLISKVTSVIIPYIVISVPAILIYMLQLKSNHYWVDMNWFNDLNFIYQYCYLMLTGAHLGPLWFIPMIILYYVISPLVIYLKNHNMLFFSFYVSILLAFYAGRPEFNDNIIQASFYFFPAYLLGLILSDNNNIYQCFTKYSGISLMCFITGYLLLTSNIGISSSIDLFLKLILSIIVLSTCYNYLYKKNKVLDMFARLSFFIFFIHGYFIGVIRALYNVLNLTNYELLAVLSIFIFAIVCSLITFVIIKLTLKSSSRKWVGI